MDAKDKSTWTYSRPEGSTLGVWRLQKLNTSLRYGILSKKCQYNLFYLICAVFLLCINLKGIYEVQ